MDESLLRLVLLLAYGPLFLILAAFCVGLLLKWRGDPSFLEWLIRKTDAQQPLQRPVRKSPLNSQGGEQK